MQNLARTSVIRGESGSMIRAAVALTIAVLGVTAAEASIDLGSGPLFRGTVAGIAVGAAVFVILLLWFLIWCLCLRRRRTWDTSYKTQMLSDHEQARDSYTSPSLAGGTASDLQQQQQSQSSIGPQLANRNTSTSNISDGRQSKTSNQRAGRMKDKLLEVSRSARVEPVSELEMNAFARLEDMPSLMQNGPSNERLSKDAQLMKWLDSSEPHSASPMDPNSSPDLLARHSIAALAALPFTAVRNLISRLPLPESDRLPLLSHLARSDPAGVVYDKLPASVAQTLASPSYASLQQNVLSPRSMLTPRGTSLSQNRSSSVNKRASPSPDGDILGGNTHTARHMVARSFTTLSGTNLTLGEDDEDDDDVQPTAGVATNGQGENLARVSLRSFNPAFANRESGIVFDSVALGGLSFSTKAVQSPEARSKADAVALAMKGQPAFVAIHVMDHHTDRYASTTTVVDIEEQPYLNSVLSSMVRDTSSAALQSSGSLSSQPSVTRWALNPHQVHHQHVLHPAPHSPHASAAAAAFAAILQPLPAIPTPPEPSPEKAVSSPLVHQSIMIEDQALPSSRPDLELQQQKQQPPQQQQQMQNEDPEEKLQQQSTFSLTKECTDSFLSSIKGATDSSSSSTLLKIPHLLPSLLPSQATAMDTQAASLMSQFDSPRHLAVEICLDGAEPVSPVSDSPFLPLPSSSVMPTFSPLASSSSIPVVSASAASTHTVTDSVSIVVTESQE